MDINELWTPRTELPRDLVRPSRLDPAGRTGPTRCQARYGRWVRTSRGWFVPADTDRTRVEQRILEQSMRTGDRGAVTAWASLRWHGARYFTGKDLDGTSLEVPINATGGVRRRHDGLAAFTHAQLAPYEREFVRGVWCSTARRACFDEVHRLRGLRPGVVAVCMAMAAGVTTLQELLTYADMRTSWESVPLFREVLTLSNECFRSPAEVDMCLVWCLDAGLAPPEVNRPVFDRQGRLLGYPDLFDPELGVVGEYDGAAHKSRERHRRDVAREQRMREAGLEYFAVVGGDLRDRDLVVDRMRAARARARRIPVSARRWTLEPPPWWSVPSWLPDRYRPAS